MEELKLIILMGGPAVLTVLLYRLIADEEDRSLMMMIVWMLIPLAATVTKSIFVVFALIIPLKLYFLRNDVQKNIAFFLFLFPALPEGFAVEFWEKGNLHIANLNLQFVLALFLLVPLIPKIWALQRDGDDSEGISVESQRRSLFGLAFPLFLGLLYFGTFRERFEFPVTIYSAIREVFTFTMTIAIPYYAITRTIKRVEDFEYYLKALALSGIFLALSAFVEEAFRWKLYHQFGLYMNTFLAGSIETLYEFRGPILRVSGSLTHPITFGFYLTIVLGGVHYLARRKEASLLTMLLFFSVFAGAIFLTVSRGAMIGVAIFLSVLLVYRFSLLVRRALVGALLVTVGVYIVSSNISFDHSESSASENEIEDLRTFDYRLEIAKTSLEVIPRQFWLGSRTYKGEPEMQKLVQGQGIVDMVNGYIHITMDYGVLGMLAFLVLQLRALYTANQWVRLGEEVDISRYRTLGAVMFAVLVSIYIQFVSTSFNGPIISYFFIIFALVLGTRPLLLRLASEEDRGGESFDALTASAYQASARGY